MTAIEKASEYFRSKRLVLLLLLSLLVLSFCGVGNIPIVSAMGIVLCLFGCLYGAAKVDLAILVPLLVFDGLSMASSAAAFGTITAGFAATQTIFTVLYLLMAHLDDEQRIDLRRLCVLWIGLLALAGIGQFTAQAFSGGAERLASVLGNPNAFGVLLVIGWFALESLGEKRGKLILLEPILFTALALTLSLGSFLALAVGILVLFVLRARRHGLRPAARQLLALLGRLVLGVGIGLALYMGGRGGDHAWLCIPVLVYLVFAAIKWRSFASFLERSSKVAAVLVVIGLAMLALVAYLRPNAAATMTERIEMMSAAMGYLFMDPLLGVGPYHWRIYDYADGGTYFNTWHIHNAFLHVGVELGLVAMIALIVVAVRFFMKRRRGEVKAGFAAFLAHCMVDTGFFYEAIPSLTLLCFAKPREGGCELSAIIMRALFLVLAAFFAFVFVSSLI